MKSFPVTFAQGVRLKQMPKNLLLFAAFVYSNPLTDWHTLLIVTAGFTIFCLLSGAVYLINDMADVAMDRAHPIKKMRPFAAGRLSMKTGVLSALLFIGLAGGWAARLGRGFVITAGLYIGVNILYTFVLKHMVLLDVFTVAFGFILRAYAGVALLRHTSAEHVEITPWFLMCTFFLALFLILGKRRHEITVLKENKSLHRPILREYSLPLLDQMIGVTTTLTILSYTLWTIFGNLAGKHFVYTVPFVVYGIFRYMYLIYTKDMGGTPEDAFVEDPPLLAAILIWVCCSLYLFNRA